MTYLPNDPKSKADQWARYATTTADRVNARPTVEAALGNFLRQGRPQAGLAIDLGCGAGSDTRYLANTGWDVMAIDSSKGAIDILKRLIKNKSPLIAAGALTIMGQIELYDFDEPNTAEEHLKEAIDRYGRHPEARDAYRSLNDLYIRRGDFESAENILRRML